MPCLRARRSCTAYNALALLELTSVRSVTVSPGMRADLVWWRNFLPGWAGASSLPLQVWVASRSLELETDASYHGWGAWGDRWIHGEWSLVQRQHAGRSIMQSMPFYELYAIAQAALQWGSEWSGHRVLFVGDCHGLILALNKGYLHRPHMAALLRVLAAYAVRHQWEWKCEWVAGESNIYADALSRGEVQAFRGLLPSANPTAERLRHGTPLEDSNYSLGLSDC